MKIISYLSLICFAITFANGANAAVGDIGPVFVDNMSTIANASGIQTESAHIPGNFEIKIRNGFTVPPGLNCTAPYITTLRTTDPDKAMFAVLLIAQTNNQPLFLRITDHPAFMAFPGRCSLVWINMSPSGNQ